jgi:hypothetical protein
LGYNLIHSALNYANFETREELRHRLDQFDREYISARYPGRARELEYGRNAAFSYVLIAAKWDHDNRVAESQRHDTPLARLLMVAMAPVCTACKSVGASVDSHFNFPRRLIREGQTYTTPFDPAYGDNFAAKCSCSGTCQQERTWTSAPLQLPQLLIVELIPQACNIA